MCSDIDNTKKFLELIFIKFPYYPIDDCLRYFYQSSLVIGPCENTLWEQEFFKVRLRVALLLV